MIVFTRRIAENTEGLQSKRFGFRRPPGSRIGGKQRGDLVGVNAPRVPLAAQGEYAGRILKSVANRKG